MAQRNRRDCPRGLAQPPPTKKIDMAVTNDDKLTRNIERLFLVIMSL
jgi:hypothetical protein